jgi:hypothetical protein
MSILRLPVRRQGEQANNSYLRLNLGGMSQWKPNL